MTSLEIEAYANEEGLAIGAKDANLAIRLRRKVIPRFEADIGDAAWRRKYANLPLVVGTAQYDLPNDFSDMLEYPLYDTGSMQKPLFYIGQNTPMIASVFATVVNGTPSGWWVDRLAPAPPASTELRRVHFDKAPDIASTLRYGYLWTLRFVDMSTIVEFDNYIPLPLQWALVEALKAELYLIRAGSVDDPRIQIARNEYMRYLNQGLEYAEPGRKEVLKKARPGPI